MGLREVSELPREEAIARLALRTRQYAAYQRKWMRRLPGLLAWPQTALRARSPMRFSRWQALGNVYLLAERDGPADELTPESARAACREGDDGILEVVAVEGDEAEIVIWNPDGSTAELSGNGTRIAARWLADRTGAETVGSAWAGVRSSPACSPTAGSSRTWGRSASTSASGSPGST